MLIVGGAAVAAFLWLRQPGRGVESNTGTGITGATQDPLPTRRPGDIQSGVPDDIRLANVAAPKVVPSGTRLGVSAAGIVDLASGRGLCKFPPSQNLTLALPALTGWLDQRANEEPPALFVDQNASYLDFTRTLFAIGQAGRSQIVLAVASPGSEESNRGFHITLPGAAPDGTGTTSSQPGIQILWQEGAFVLERLSDDPERERTPEDRYESPPSSSVEAGMSALESRLKKFLPRGLNQHAAISAQTDTPMSEVLTIVSLAGRAGYRDIVFRVGAAKIGDAPAVKSSNPTTDPSLEGKPPGVLPRGAAEAVLRESRTELRQCYLGRLKENPSLSGTIILSILVSETGRVRDVSLAERTELREPKLLTCAQRELQKLKFPAPRGGEVRLELPLTFRPD